MIGILYKYKARLVSSRGTTGQKCPRWHIDHVPLRLVMTLDGPGPMYVPFQIEDESSLSLPLPLPLHPQMVVDRSALNGLEIEDTEQANSVILPRGEEGVAVTASVGEAILLMGKAWEKKDDNSAMDSRVLAVPHRSPEIEDGQLRVLITVDVIPT